MIYLTGAYRKEQAPKLIRLGVGVMLQPGSGYAKAVEPLGFGSWAADNGCFAKGDKFNLDKFYAWLADVPRSRLLFAVAPDVFPDAAATLTRSLPVLSELRAAGYRTAFVAQNHAEMGPIPWDDFDALFLGGEDHWKLGHRAARLTLDARRRGKWVHMGRVNSERRLKYAEGIGCHSADGTFLAFRNRIGDGAADVARWYVQPQLPFFGESYATLKTV